jgi:hypothetical protein
MKPMSVVIPASGTIDVPLDQYLTPQQISWAGTVTSVTGLVGEMTTYNAQGLPVGGAYTSSAGSPSGSGIWQQPGQTTETAGVSPTGYIVSGSALTSPVLGGAFSALRVVGTAGNVVTINQAGVR